MNSFSYKLHYFLKLDIIGYVDSSIALKIFYWDYFFLIYGSTGLVPNHKHNAIQIFISPSKYQKIQIGDSLICSPIIILNKNIEHKVLKTESDNISILIDGDSEFARHLAHSIEPGKGYSTDPFLLSFLKNDFKSPESIRLGFQKYMKEEGCPLCFPLDERIKRAKILIDNNEEKKIALSNLSRQLGLSESRLAHLFKSEIGIPLRKYLLWKRLVSAMQIIVQGHNLTYAAYESGFSDSAHLSRTFKSNFGFNLSKIFQNSRFIQFQSL